MYERRSYQRYPVQLDVRLKQLDEASSDMDATITDVSTSGIKIIVGKELQPGTEVAVEWLSAPFYYDGELVEKGTVISIERTDAEDGQFRLNVKFLDADSKLVQSLLNWAQMQDSAKKRSRSGANRFTGQRKNR